MKNGRIYDFTIPANGSFQLNVEGEYVRIMSSTGNVELVTENYRLGPLASGQGQANTPFKRLTINDKSGSVNIGSILVAANDFVDQRISGEVSVIDGGKSRSKTGVAFATRMTFNSDATNYGYGQFWNPAGSGKNLIVEKLSITAGSAGIVGIGSYSTALTNLSTNIPTPKMLGSGAVSSMVMRNQFSNTYLPWLIYGSYYSAANQLVAWESKSPYVIQPGTGLVVDMETYSVAVIAMIEYFEEPIN